MTPDRAELAAKVRAMAGSLTTSEPLTADEMASRSTADLLPRAAILALLESTDD